MSLVSGFYGHGHGELRYFFMRSPCLQFALNLCFVEVLMAHYCQGFLPSCILVFEVPSLLPCKSIALCEPVLCFPAFTLFIPSARGALPALPHHLSGHWPILQDTPEAPGSQSPLSSPVCSFLPRLSWAFCLCCTWHPSLGSLFPSCQYFNRTPLLHWARAGVFYPPDNLTQHLAMPGICAYCEMGVKVASFSPFPFSYSYLEVEGCGNVWDPKRILHRRLFQT